ncbi:MAG: peptide deformylase [Candidatus Kryptoniota bacterium]
MIMPIHLYGTKVWDGPAKKVAKFDDKLAGLIRDMFETMHNADGIGLAANQVGLQMSLAVIDISIMEDYADEKPLVVVNPEILEGSGEKVMEEGCLSVPGIRDEVTRADKITVRFTNGNFERVETELSGMWARVFQHEYDHLQQRFFVNRLSSVKRQILKPKLSKVKRGEMLARYPVVSVIDEKKLG